MGTISSYPAATMPLDGTEAIAAEQNGAQVRISANALFTAPAIKSVVDDLALGSGSFIRQSLNAAIIAAAQAGIATSEAAIAIASAQQAGAALAGMTAPIAAVNALAGVSATYPTYAAANGAIGNIAAGADVLVLADETRGNQRSIYQKANGALTFVLSLPGGGNRDIWVDPANGSDQTGAGTRAQPYKTMGMMLTVAQPGDTVRFPPATVIREQWGLDVYGNSTYNIPLNYVAADGVTFQNMDSLFGVAWSAAGSAYPAVYSAPVTHAWGATDGTFAQPGQGFAPQMLVDQTRLIEMQINPNPAEANQYPDEPSALAAVQATPGSFYVRGLNGSSMTKGWQAGQQTYFVHTPTGDTPSNHLVNFGNRMAPFFGEYSTIRGKTTVFGGIGHDGVIMRGCDVEDMSIWFPCHHACFCLGSYLKRIEVRGANQTHGGFAYHDFGVSGSYLGVTTRLDECSVWDWHGGLNTVFGVHGTNDSVSPYVGRQLLTNNFKAFNVSSISLGDSYHMFGAVHRNMTALGVQQVTFGGQYVAENPVFVGGNLTPPGSALFADAGGAGSGTVIGGYSIAAPGTSLFAISSAVALNFVDHHVLFDGDLLNGRWLQVNAGPTSLNFTRCVVESTIVSMDPLGEACNAQTALNFVDCHLSGINPTSGGNLTVSQSGTAVGGKSGLCVGGDGRLASGPINTTRQLGQDVIDVDSGFLTGSVALLTSKGLHQVNTSGIYNSNSWSPPAGVVLNGLGNAENYTVIYGSGGAVYKVPRGDPNAGDVKMVVGAPSKNFIAAVDAVENYVDTDLFLLADDGSITEYKPNGDVFTNRASPVTYALRGGSASADDSNTKIAWGDGGAIVSTDGGQTWAKSIDNGDGTNAATYYNQITCSGYANRQFFLWCNKGVLLVSPSGASGSWKSYQMQIGQGAVRSMAVDPNRLLGVGVADQQAWPGFVATRAQSIVRFDFSNADPSKWAIIDVLPTPLPAVKKVVHFENYAQGLTAFAIAGKVAQLAISDDGKSAAQVSAYSPGFTQTTWRAPVETLRVAALQPTP